MDSPFLDISWKWNRAISNPWCLASFTLRNIFKVHLRYSLLSAPHSFYDWTIFHCMNTSPFVYPFICWWAFWLLWMALFWIVLLWISAWRFLFEYFFSVLWSTYVEMELLVQMVSLRIIIRGTTKLFPTTATSFYIFIVMYKGSNLPTFSSLVIFSYLLRPSTSYVIGSNISL